MIQFKRVLPNAKVPTRATRGSAGFDLYVGNLDIDLQKGIATVDTGLQTAFSPGFVLLVYPRSGLATKWGFSLKNTVGVIDSDYRGNILLKFDTNNHDFNDIVSVLEPGARVAQAILTPIINSEWLEVSELPDTYRGAGGFGSTGS